MKLAKAFAILAILGAAIAAWFSANGAASAEVEVDHAGGTVVTSSFKKTTAKCAATSLEADSYDWKNTTFLAAVMETHEKLEQHGETHLYLCGAQITIHESLFLIAEATSELLDLLCAKATSDYTFFKSNYYHRVKEARNVAKTASAEINMTKTGWEVLKLLNDENEWHRRASSLLDIIGKQYDKADSDNEFWLFDAIQARHKNLQETVDDHMAKINDLKSRVTGLEPIVIDRKKNYRLLHNTFWNATLSEEDIDLHLSNFRKYIVRGDSLRRHDERRCFLARFVIAGLWWMESIARSSGVF